MRTPKDDATSKVLRLRGFGLLGYALLASAAVGHSAALTEASSERMGRHLAQSNGHSWQRSWPRMGKRLYEQHAFVETKAGRIAMADEEFF